ncbi:MAG: TolC family protein [Candidatus Gastranaerophilales bacterium]|nr:TolC family protein [Candidatus Gastranaerophilales bacterium]
MKRIFLVLIMFLMLSQSVFADTIQGKVEEHKFLSLEQCLNIALEKNPTIVSAKKNSDAYKTRIAQAKAAYFPSVEFRSGGERSNPITNNVNRFMDRNVSNFRLGEVTLSQQFYDFGRTRANVNVQKANYDYTLAETDDVIDTVVFKVKDAYYYLLYTIHQYNVAKDMVEQYQLQLKRAQAFYTIGTKPKLDVTIAQLNLKDANLNLIKSENAMNIATAALNNAMGEPFIDPYNLKDELGFVGYDIDFEKAYQIAKDHRPKLKMAEQRIKYANESVKFAQRTYMPKIQGTAMAGKGGAQFNGDDGWAMGVFLQLPVTNAYLSIKQIDEARALYDKETADAEKIRQDVYFEVQKSYYDLLQSSKAIPVAKDGVKKAKENYDLASGRYKVGFGDPIELKDAEVSYQNSQLDYYNALYSYNKSLAEFERVVGASVDKVLKESVEAKEDI